MYTVHTSTTLVHVCSDYLITALLHNPQKGERTRYFGSPLDTVVESDGVPVFVKKCVQIIEERGLKAEGIYRVSGKKEDCLTLQERFDEGDYH